MSNPKQSTKSFAYGSPEWDELMTSWEGYSTKEEAIEGYKKQCEKEIQTRLDNYTSHRNIRKQWVKFDPSGIEWVMPTRFKLDHSEAPDEVGFWRMCKLKNGKWSHSGMPRSLQNNTINAAAAGVSRDSEKAMREIYSEAMEASIGSNLWTNDSRITSNYLERMFDDLSQVFVDDIPKGVWVAIERAFMAGRFEERSHNYVNAHDLDKGFEQADRQGKGREEGATGNLKKWQERAGQLWKDNPTLTNPETMEKLDADGFISWGKDGAIFKGDSGKGVKDAVEKIRNFRRRGGKIWSL
jgi:hypothetical protein